MPEVDDVKKNTRRLWNGKDGILILSLLFIALLAGVWWYIRSSRPSSGGRVCYIEHERAVVMTVPLDVHDLNTDYTFSIEQLPQVVFEVRDGNIAFVQSDCPDQVCVHTGFLGQPGQFAACLPNRISIRIDGETDINAPDVILLGPRGESNNW